MAAPEVGDVPFWQQALAGIGLLATLVGVVVKGIRGESSETKEKARSLVIDHADAADTQPFIEALSEVNETLQRIEKLMRDRLSDDEKRQMRIDARSEVQREMSGNRVFEDIVEKKFNELKAKLG